MANNDNDMTRPTDPVLLIKKGEQIGDRYQVVEFLGRGGMAEVYKAYHPGLNRYIAIKVLHGYLADDDDFVGRFSREARAVANLRHQNIVQVFDFDIHQEMYYMAMEFVNGPSLKQELRERAKVEKSFTLEEVARVMIAGADIWLNTPLRPLEASGTSGMKAAINGVPNLSVLDGWWVEGCIEGITGWAIGKASSPEENGSDAAALYDKLEQV